MAPAHPLIVAHRGASASARENTLEAFRLAVAQDADGIEFDVRRTADDVLVVHHDPVVEGVGPLLTNGFDRVRQQAPWVPTLDEVVPATGDLLLDIEVKTEPSAPDAATTVARRVAEWVVDHHLERRAVVTAFDPDAVAAVRQDGLDVATGLLIGPAASISTGIGQAAELGHRWVLPAALSLQGRVHTLVDEAHRAGVAIVTWTADAPDLICLLAAAGVDGIVTNDPAAALEALTGATAP